MQRRPIGFHLIAPDDSSAFTIESFHLMLSPNTSIMESDAFSLRLHRVIMFCLAILCVFESCVLSTTSPQSNLIEMQTLLKVTFPVEKLLCRVLIINIVLIAFDPEVTFLKTQSRICYLLGDLTPCSFVHHPPFLIKGG